MADRFVYEAKYDGQGQLFATTGKASKFLRESYKASFPSGSLTALGKGEINEVTVKGKRDGEKLEIVLVRRQLH